MQAGIYRHYKGGYYQVLGVAAHSETGERMVVYVSLSGIDLPGPRLRVRPLDGPEGFMDSVPNPNLTGGSIDRYRYVGDDLPNKRPAPK